jgi:hypothetical protein
MQRDGAAQRVPDHRGPLHLEPFEQLREEVAVEVQQLGHTRLAGAAERRHVDRDHAMAGQQAGRHPAPAVRRVAVAVDEQDGRPLAGVDDVGRHAADVDQPMRQLATARVVQSGMLWPAAHGTPSIG